ncbi:carcinoembryonic antigen-related cell adhesion molecule 5-like [Elgaria multicarinata webbii]|uniref:carcinoembryonic antigen-related cell adhesion molecule 5-like n=1 Tax=Elgaria multicarinata webbii TaxID=159646 RepID=UPI002FCD1841
MDDPNSVKISPPGNITQLLGSLLTLTCNADSIPAPRYSWFFNNTNVNVTSSNLTINLTSWGSEGEYKCCVYNPETDITYSASVTVKITTAKETSTHLMLPRKVIAGIVIGLVAGIILIVTLLCYFCARAWRKKPPPPPMSIPSLYVELPPAQSAGSSSKPENPDDSSITYQELQYGDESLYQELEK